MLFPDTVPRETIKTAQQVSLNGTLQQVNWILPDSPTSCSQRPARMQCTMMCVETVCHSEFTLEMSHIFILTSCKKVNICLQKYTYIKAPPIIIHCTWAHQPPPIINMAFVQKQSTTNIIFWWCRLCYIYRRPMQVYGWAGHGPHVLHQGSHGHFFLGQKLLLANVIHTWHERLWALPHEVT
jgi:hypothetical protein